MYEIKNDKSVKILCVAMAIILLLGVFVSLMPITRNNATPTSAEGKIEEKKNTDKIITTSEPENYSSLLKNMLKLKNQYPNLLRIFTLGYSEKGKAIPMFTLGSGSKKALVTAGIHAREHLTVKYMLKCVEDYCWAYENSKDGFYGDFNLKALFSEYTLYIIPCINPDGLEIVLGREKPQKNVYVNMLEDYKANFRGVDLNRNFPLAWKEIDNGVTRPNGYFFKGYKSGSESETKALMKLCEENSFDFLLSFHVKGNCIFWGDMHDTSKNNSYKAFAEDIASASGFRMTSPTLRPTNYGGGFENWFRHKFKRPGLCVELTDVENIISPCGNTNYKAFDKIVNYKESSNAIGAALNSKNK